MTSGTHWGCLVFLMIGFTGERRRFSGDGGHNMGQQTAAAVPGGPLPEKIGKRVGMEIAEPSYESVPVPEPSEGGMQTNHLT
jgi:hypothetical protein